MAKRATSTQSFDSTQRQCAEIISQAKAGRYAPIYLLHGAEGYFIDKIESYISQNALPEEQKSFNQTTIYGKDSSGAEVVTLARRYPMMSEVQLVVVREAQSLKGIEDLAHYIQEPLSSTILVICHRDKALDKRSSLYKKFAAAKGAIVFESTSPKDYEVSKFVNANLSERGLSAEPTAVEMISENIGANLTRISGEIDKLVTRLGAGRHITANDVEENIGISKQFNVFELCKSLSFRKFTHALKIAEHLSANSKETPLILTINALFTHFQRVTTLGFIRFEAQQKRNAMPSDIELSKVLKLPNPYFLSEYTTAINNYRLPSCVAILGLLRTWDLKCKGMDVGSADDGELLRDLILRISLS